jgi:8-oxo-dGTP pyrophosphatase MutT (NUDIX family)
METLLLQRSSRLGFGAGAWVFPGGRVDAGDWAGGVAMDEMGTARRAAVREALEETGLVVDEGALLPFSHWTPPPGRGHRFSTWFFLCPAPAGEVEADVVVDGGEIVDHVWVRPRVALKRHAAGEVELLPPTWITLWMLSEHADVATAMAETARRTPERFATRFTKVEGGLVALYHGDAAYEDLMADRPGARHRLWMVGPAWRYERS